MCHPTCRSCETGKNTFTDCTACIGTRYFFSKSCLCPKDEDQNSDYKCEEFDDQVTSLQDFIYALQWGFLVLMLLSLFVKRHIPLTRKLIDVSQTLGLLFYLHQFYEPRPSIVFQLFQMTNLSSLIPNYIALYFYGEKMDQTSSDSYKFLNMLDDEQIPPYKFLINGKSSNFLMNQLQVFVIWIVGLIIFLFVGAGLSIIKQGKGFCEYIRFNLMNYVYIIFYFTFQESFLNVFLQLNNLKWTQGIHYAALITMVIYLFFSILIIRSILISQNSYPSDPIQKRIEMFRRRDQCHFLFAFEDPLTDIVLQQRSEKTHLSPSELIISNWVVLSLIQKAIMTAVIVFQYDKKVEISLIVIIIIFFKLFFLVRPIKNKIVLVFCFIADCYVIVVIVLSGKEYLSYLLWPGILCLNWFMIVEDVFSNKCYPTVQETSYMEKIAHLEQRQLEQNRMIDEKQMRGDVILQNPVQTAQLKTGQTPQYTNKPIELPKQQNQADISNQIPLRNESIQDQSIINKQDNSMMNQNLIQNETINQERIQTIENEDIPQNQTQPTQPLEYNKQKSQHSIVDDQLRSKQAFNANSSQNNPVVSSVKPQSKEMLDMKQKYIERIRKQNQVLLQPSNTNINGIQKINSNSQNLIRIETNDQSIQRQPSIINKNDPLNRSLQRSLNNIPEEQNRNQQGLKPSEIALTDAGRSNKINVQERDSFYDFEEEDDYDSQPYNNGNSKKGIQQQKFQSSQSNMFYSQQKPQKSNQMKPDTLKTVKQQKIEEELSQHWDFN